jgi:hypothetical protein
VPDVWYCPFCHGQINDQPSAESLSLHIMTDCTKLHCSKCGRVGSFTEVVRCEDVHHVVAGMRTTLQTTLRALNPDSDDSHRFTELLASADSALVRLDAHSSARVAQQQQQQQQAHGLDGFVRDWVARQPAEAHQDMSQFLLGGHVIM